MRTLATEFEFRGRAFLQIRRDGNVALYEHTARIPPAFGIPADINPPKRHGPPGYDVVQICVSPAQSIRGRDYPEREVYPSDEDFGTHAWYFPDLKAALERYGRLVRDAWGVSGAHPAVASPGVCGQGGSKQAILEAA